MKSVDLQLNISGLILQDDETIDDFITRLQKHIPSVYDVTIKVLYEEGFDG